MKYSRHMTWPPKPKSIQLYKIGKYRLSIPYLKCLGPQKFEISGFYRFWNISTHTVNFLGM